MDGTIAAYARHCDPLATGESMRILMELHHQTATVVLGMGKLSFRPLLVDGADEFSLIGAEFAAPFQFLPN